MFMMGNCNMKKTIFFAAALLLAVGCQKSELIEKVQEQKMITHTFSVDEEDTKSLFDPADGCIKLDKTESIAVGWAPVLGNGAKINGIVKATRNSNGKFSFSHTAVGTTNTYNYFFVMPYRGKSNISTNGDGNAMYVKIDGVQHPTATSFDPLQDYILGQPILNATEKQELSSSDLKLKRLFSPLRVTLSDGANEFDGEALMSVSIGFPTDADKKNNLATLVYLKSTETDENGNTVVADFATAGPNGYANIDTKHVSPTVTAEYTNGLAINKDNNTYTVWYVTIPVEKAAGTKLTVVAQSKNKKVTRTIDLPKAMQLQAGIINDLKINITGKGYDVEDTDPNDYWSLYNAGQDIVAGGMTINRFTHPNAVLLSGTNLTQNNLQKGGLIFVDGEFTATAHLKLAKGSIIIGRFKDSQPSITMNSSHAIYLDNGNLVLKNLNIRGTTTAGRLIVISKNTSATSSEYAIIEDCTITAPKNVCGYASDTPKYVINNLTFDNCIIKMAGTDGNYAVININKLETANTDSSIYTEIEKFEISNCVVYAEKPYTNSNTKISRRMLMDLGSGAAGGQYDFPLENAAIVVNNNTLYNINCNDGVIARAYYAKTADVNGNVIYNDYSTIAATETDKYPFIASYMFGIYSGNGNPSNGVYNVNNNYSYGYYTAKQANYVTDAKKLNNTTVKFKYRKKDNSSGNYYSPDYNTNNSKQENGQVPNNPFTTADMTKGYFPVNSTKIQKATGASYDTKPWVKVK